MVKNVVGLSNGNAYEDHFYKDRHARTLYAAERVLSIVLQVVPEIRSAVDVGCGVGTWLSVLKDKGVCDIQGVDGDWVNKDYLVIPSDYFLEWDLTKELRLARKFDLAISLEVAEHLPPESAFRFIDSLADLSYLVLFSAAIPYQGGTNHINEQWPDYWAGHFRGVGYSVFDIIRPQIWDDVKIPFWYRQNILLFVKNEKIPGLQIEAGTIERSSMPLRMVHPDLFLTKIKNSTSSTGTWRILRKVLKDWTKRIIGMKS